MSTPKDVWYDRQANISKLITYAALLILASSICWALFRAYEGFAHHTEIGFNSERVYHEAICATLIGVTISAFLVGISAIIDLLIVHAEALRSR